MKTLLSNLILFLAGLLVLVGCLGPKPVLDGAPTIDPPPKGSDQPFKVEAVIANKGPGGGQVEVKVQLIDKQTGDIIAQDSQDVQMDTNDKQHVLFEISLPPSAKDMDPGNIKVDVSAEYPIQ